MALVFHLIFYFVQIIVHIDDINDHPPVFINRTFAAVIGENMPVNSHVMRLTATDGDLTPKNRRFIFRIRSELNPSNGDMFHITPSGKQLQECSSFRVSNMFYLVLCEFAELIFLFLTVAWRQIFLCL